MRSIALIAAAGLALAIAALPAAAVDKNTANTGQIGSTSKMVVKKPGKTVKGVVGTTAGIAELTAEECTSLGGTVYEDGAGLCNNGKYCGTTDKDGKRHRVCLEAAQ